MDKVPALVRGHPITPGRHRRAVQAGHENAVEIRVRGAALEPGTGSEIVRRNGIALVVPKCRRRGAVALSTRAVTLNAFQFLLVEFLPALLRFRSVRLDCRCDSRQPLLLCACECQFARSREPSVTSMPHLGGTPSR